MYSREIELKKIKELDICLFLTQLGLKSTRTHGGKVWYCSPLTNDSSPSFCVFTDKQRWKCFSTGKGGSIIDFVMAYFNFTYQDAVKMLREKLYHTTKN